MTYSVKQIDVDFQLASGTFNGTANNVYLSGMKVDFQAHNVVFPGYGTSIALVYGMTPSQMNALTVAGLAYAASVSKNTITVLAGDAQSGMTQVWKGLISEAKPNFNGAPDVPFVVSSIGQASPMNLQPVKPGTWQGATQASTIFGQMATAAGLSYEGNGVSGQIVNPYYHGTITQQITAAARDLNCFAYVDSVAGKLVTWPKNGSRAGSPVIISPQTGMIGYPDFQGVYVIVRTLWTPLIVFGGQIQIQSELPAANGIWNIIKIDWAISSQEQEGPWEMTIMAVSPNAPAPS